MSEQKIVFDENDPTAKALRDAISKMAELGAQRAGLEKQLDGALEEQRKFITGSREARLDSEADALLGGRKREDNFSKIEKLRHEIEVLDMAIQKQQQVVSELRGKFSRYVCNHPANRETYIAIERRILAAVQELAAANEAEKKFLAKLYEIGCNSVSFRPMAIREIGIASDPNSRANLHIQELQKFVPEAV